MRKSLLPVGLFLLLGFFLVACGDSGQQAGTAHQADQPPRVEVATEVEAAPVPPPPPPHPAEYQVVHYASGTAKPIATYRTHSYRIFSAGCVAFFTTSDSTYERVICGTVVAGPLTELERALSQVTSQTPQAGTTTYLTVHAGDGSVIKKVEVFNLNLSNGCATFYTYDAANIYQLACGSLSVLPPAR